MSLLHPLWGSRSYGACFRYLVKLILFLESYLTHCYLVSGDFPPPVESTTTT